MEIVNWNRGLALAAILISIGVMAVVSARSLRDRSIAIGILTQGVVIAFVVSGAYYGRSELSAVAIPLIFLSAVWCFWDRDSVPVSAGEPEPLFPAARLDNSENLPPLPSPESGVVLHSPGSGNDASEDFR